MDLLISGMGLLRYRLSAKLFGGKQLFAALVLRYKGL